GVAEYTYALLTGDSTTADDKLKDLILSRLLEDKFTDILMKFVADESIKNGIGIDDEIFSTVKVISGMSADAVKTFIINTNNTFETILDNAYQYAANNGDWIAQNIVNSRNMYEYGLSRISSTGLAIQSFSLAQVVYDNYSKLVHDLYLNFGV